VKYIAWVIVIILNLFFVYFSIIRALQRGGNWQRGYAYACVFQFIVEIVLYETTECIWVHFLIPNLVTQEIQTVHFALRQSIDAICNKGIRNPQFFLDAPNYLFVSTSISKHFPNLIESVIIQSYHYHLPGELAKKWMVRQPHEVLRQIQGRRRLTLKGLFNFTLTSIMIHFLTTLGASSATLQRMIVHSLQPLLLTSFMILFPYLKKYPEILAVLSVVVLYKAIVEFNKYRIQRGRERVIHLRDIEGSKIRPLSTQPDTSTSWVSKWLLGGDKAAGVALGNNNVDDDGIVCNDNNRSNIDGSENNYDTHLNMHDNNEERKSEGGDAISDDGSIGPWFEEVDSDHYREDEHDRIQSLSEVGKGRVKTTDFTNEPSPKDQSNAQKSESIKTTSKIKPNITNMTEPNISAGVSSRVLDKSDKVDEKRIPSMSDVEITKSPVNNISKTSTEIRFAPKQIRLNSISESKGEGISQSVITKSTISREMHMRLFGNSSSSSEDEIHCQLKEIGSVNFDISSSEEEVK
jgi:hypothetical protein